MREKKSKQTSKIKKTNEPAGQKHTECQDTILPRPEEVVKYFNKNGRLPDDFNPYGDYVINFWDDLLFIGDKKPSTYDESYNGADDSFLINDLDPDSKTICISLPRPPRLDLIDNHDLPIEEQYFRHFENPLRLRELEQNTLEYLKEEIRSNKNRVITGAKLIEAFWERLSEEAGDYKEEIKFIKHFWWYRIYGYWFFNNGKPTYIPGCYFTFLNFFYIPDIKENNGRPEYRDRHRREFLFREYLAHAHHTFEKRDEKGWAIAEEDGSYKMTDMKRTIFYGDIMPKSRRNGSTSIGLHSMVEYAELGQGRYSTMISKDGDSTELHFKKDLLPYWSSRPLWIKPVWKGGYAPETIKYFPPQNAYGFETLMSVVDYTTSAGTVKRDGSKFNGFILFDEEGKADTQVNVQDRWDVYKHAMSLGDGTKIIGRCSHVSTVEDINSSGKAFLDILAMSNFYQRGNNGQTLSGLAAMFFPSYDGLEGFIDRFGYSVIDHPTEKQVELTPGATFAMIGKGAYQYQEENRRDFLERGTPEALRSYRAYVKKFPWRSSELSVGTSGDIGFNYEILDKRISELRKLKSLNKLPVKRGNFYRENNNPEGRVYWRTEEEGKFEISMDMPPNMTNLKKTTIGWDVIKGQMSPMFEPVYKSKMICGADPFEFGNQRTDMGSSKHSDGGIAVLRMRDESIDTDGDPRSWSTFGFVCIYRYPTATLAEYNEDVLMACEYYGAMLFTERNKTGTWEHFIRRGRGGYLMYEVDIQTGRPAEKPGYYLHGQNKDELFNEIRDFIEFHGDRVVHLKLLEEFRNIRYKDELTKYDLAAAAGAALYGSKSPYGRTADKLIGNKIDLSKSWLNPLY